MYVRKWTSDGLLVTTLASSLLLAGCFGDGLGSSDKPEELSDEDPKDKTPTEKVKAGQFKAKNIGFDSTEESNPSVGFFTSDDGELGIRVSGMEHEGDVVKPEVDNLRVEEGDTASSAAFVPLSDDGSGVELTCSDVATGEAGLGDVYDIGISLDTTGSMGGAAGVFAEEIVSFANELTGLDVQFSGITVGDAYATKKPEGETEFGDSVSLGSLGEPPSFDLLERPDTGTELLSADELEVFFKEVNDWVGSGQGGGDRPENFLGSVDYLHSQLEWREDAGRILIVIGDAPAHTPDTMPGSHSIDETSPWFPPEPGELESDLARAGASVNLIWNPFGFSPLGDYYTMDDLADATGGSITEFSSCSDVDSCDVELTEIPAIRAVTSERSTKACAITTEASEFTVRFDVSVAGSRFWAAEAVIERDSL